MVTVAAACKMFLVFYRSLSCFRIYFHSSVKEKYLQSFYEREKNIFFIEKMTIFFRSVRSGFFKESSLKRKDPQSNTHTYMSNIWI